jgi:AcrR family transcriptional regulator
MATPQSAHPAGRRFSENALLDAARDVFDARGFNATQVADIARAAGTTKPTLYARLGSKEEIYLRVLEREADVLKTWLWEVYERAEALPLHTMVQAGMEPFFRFAAERRAGFDALLRSEPGGPGSTVARRTEDEIIQRLTNVIQRRSASVGQQIDPASAGALAAASVGVAIQVAQHALDRDRDLDAAAAIAVMFTENAFRALDPAALKSYKKLYGPRRR